MTKLFMALVLIPFTTFANPNLCEDFARGFTIGTHLAEYTGIQGHEYGSQILSQELDRKGKSTRFIVAVEANNDEGDVWTVKYSVFLTLPNCGDVQIRELNN